MTFNTKYDGESAVLSAYGKAKEGYEEYGPTAILDSGIV